MSLEVQVPVEQGILKVQVKRLPGAEGLPLPQYMSPGAAGVDLSSAQTLEIKPGERVLVPTGMSMALPPGYEAQVRPRSGLAIRHGVTVLNAPGTIDSDYRGEICVILVNFGQKPYQIQRGDRIAQMVVAPVVQVTFEESAELPSSRREAGGFGHTGR